MIRVTEEECTPATVNAAANCAARITDFLRVHLEAERLQIARRQAGLGGRGMNSTRLLLFQHLVEVGNALEMLRDMYVPESDQWLWHTEVLGLLDGVIDMLVHSQGIRGSDDRMLQVYGAPQIGFPDADVTCADCEGRNFHGDPLRKPPKQQRQDTPQPWWQRERLPLARYTGMANAPSSFVQGPWTWSGREGALRSVLDGW